MLKALIGPPRGVTGALLKPVLVLALEGDGGTEHARMCRIRLARKRGGGLLMLLPVFLSLSPAAGPLVIQHSTAAAALLLAGPHCRRDDDADDDTQSRRRGDEDEAGCWLAPSDHRTGGGSFGNGKPTTATSANLLSVSALLTLCTLEEGGGIGLSIERLIEAGVGG